MTFIWRRSLRAWLRPSSGLLTQQTHATAAAAAASCGGARHVHVHRRLVQAFPFPAVGMIGATTWTTSPSPTRHRDFTTTPSHGSMLGSLKGMLGFKEPHKEFEIPDDFGLDGFAKLNRKLQSQSPDGKGPLHQFNVKLDADQIDALVAVMTAEEKAQPGLLWPQDWRRVASRVAPRWNVTSDDVRGLIFGSAMLKIIMNRTASEIKSGRMKVPKTQAELAAALAASQQRLTPEQRKAEAKALNGAFPANQPCICMSGKKYGSCCDPKKSAKKVKVII